MSKAWDAKRELEDKILAKAVRILDGRHRTGDPVTSPSQAGGYFRLRLAGARREIFAVMFLDCRHRVIAVEELFYGTIDTSAVYPRDVVRRALELDTVAVMFAHNHPSGDTEPSAADRALTTRLREALALVDVRVLDHLVVGTGGYTSFAERGWL